MREIEKYFVINSFEDGWGIDELAYEELLLDYCTEVLFIPYEKIEDVSINSNAMEIILGELELEEIEEDWYINLLKLHRDISSKRYSA